MGQTLNLHFIHPTDSRELNVDIDASMTAAETIAELVAANFIPASPEGYKLAVKGGRELNSNQSFAQAEVMSDSRIRITPATDAGYLA